MKIPRHLLPKQLLKADRKAERDKVVPRGSHLPPDPAQMLIPKVQEPLPGTPERRRWDLEERRRQLNWKKKRAARLGGTET